MLVSASFLSSKDIPKFLTKLNDTVLIIFM